MLWKRRTLWKVIRFLNLIGHAWDFIMKQERRLKKLSDMSKDIIKSIPNFNAEIFKECTGIEVE